MAKTHIFETLEKLYRECHEGVCTLSNATRIELEEALRNLIAGEEHIGEVLKEKDIEELRRLIDEIRKLRQEMALTNIPFRAELPVKEDAIKTLEDIYRRVDELISKVDKYATEMKQELSDVECPTCKEDLEVVPVIQVVKEKLGYMSREEIEKYLKELAECFNVKVPDLEYEDVPKCEAWYTIGTNTIHLTSACGEKELLHEFYHYLADLKGEAEKSLLHEIEAEVFTKLMKEYDLCERGKSKKINKGERLNYTRLRRMVGVKDVLVTYASVIGGEKIIPKVGEFLDAKIGGAELYKKPSVWIDLALGIGVPVASVMGKLPSKYELPLLLLGATSASRLIDLALSMTGVSAYVPVASAPPVYVAEVGEVEEEEEVRQFA